MTKHERIQRPEPGPLPPRLLTEDDKTAIRDWVRGAGGKVLE